jgi:protein ImuB
MHWLCLHFPDLPLEVFTFEDRPFEDRTLEDRIRPRAITTGTSRAQWILSCNSAARVLGIVPGMRLGAAHALADIEVFPRKPEAELAALERLGVWSAQFTSMIHIAPPANLLLEIGASLTLFGGIEALCAKIKAGIAKLDYRASLASAPTPLAAEWLAISGKSVHIFDKQKLPGALAGLDLALLEPGKKALASLHGMGLHQVGELQRLPRDGLARRISPKILALLDQALGHRADPRSFFELPAKFVSRVELPYEVANTEALLFVARRQLLELIGFLRARVSGVQRLEWQLIHSDVKASNLSVGLLSPSSDLNHLLMLLREQLQNFSLPAPVEVLVLEVEDILLTSGSTQDLFYPDKGNEGDGAVLVERLRARLGADAITGVCLVAEHRPEYAWRTCTPGELGPQLDVNRRPLWLLPHPVPLEIVDGKPYLHGRLKMASQAERIEAGWWDGNDVERDYFIASNTHGSHYWIFRDLSNLERWFLHGVFE